ncbi:uncharacterized protein LOC128677538 [Plodia interpunctella]|uniref:uncharacterized protein LOC128677538 n=1 Tax=Plodia interpunctella TaxID=58824 RepID=UPI002367B91B|nr:uncharacterized protein LOC128677538 [Plodia interpunctella]XP_053614439.1 uncharacterized protein LOC128677538 [Plodia interpunctella]
MALLLILIMATSTLSASTNVGEMALANVTRLASGDIFSLVGTDCGPTRCMEVSHGTALAAMGGDGCMCKCRRETPAFREDQRICINHIDECSMATFGRSATKPEIPFVFLPLKGQIVYPSKEIIFTEVKDAVCGVVSAQYLSPSGWVTLRDGLDNDVPFSVYRDEGSTFLQWRGSAALHSKLEGRLVAAHVLCSTPEQQVATSCAAFRVAGASHTSLLDVRSIPFHAGEAVTPDTTQNQGLSVLESLAIGVCALMLIFIYAAGIIFYVHYKQRQKRREKDPENSNSMENGSMDSRMDMDNVQLKTNPLLSMGNVNAGFCHDSGLSDVSEHTEETLDSSPNNTQKFQKPNSNVIAAIVHNRRKKPTRPSVRASTTPERISERLQRRSASPDTFERAPHSDLSIIDCSMEGNSGARQPLQSSNGEPALRKKLYFNPVFFETEHLKNPPPAAIEFLMKIREIMSIAKDKMISKRFIPMLSDIPEEDLYHSIDLGWDLPCARRGRRFSAISLKQENSRRAIHCGGCPGCDSNMKSKKLTRSNSCKTCVSDDYKQRIVRKWLDEVPSPSPSIKPIKSVAKISGTPRILETKLNSEVRPRSAEPLSNEQNGPMTPEAKHKQKSNNEIRNETVEIINDDNIIKYENEISKNTTLPNTIKIHDEKSPSNHISRRIRKKLPPPPPPPVDPPEPIRGEDEEEVPILPEVKLKMEAVIRELSKCRRPEPKELDDLKMETVTPIPPKIIIPVVAADSHYYSDDNMLTDKRKKEQLLRKDIYNIEIDSLDRSIIQKHRRFSLACGPELNQLSLLEFQQKMPVSRGRLTSSWRDLKKDDYQDRMDMIQPRFVNRSEILINNCEPIYDNITNLGPLTIKVSGSPVENRRNKDYEDFDPDTLDRKPKREPVKRVEKILLKSGGSFKYKVSAPNENDNNPPATTIQSPPEEIFNRKIGSLRQIYEMKTKAHTEMQFYNRRGSLPYTQDVAGFVKSLKTPDLIRQLETPRDPKPPIPPKQRRGSELSPKFSHSFRDSASSERRRTLEERDRFPPYTRIENINARRSGRRSARTRSRRTDLRKLYRTEDSGYMSTDSNESKRRAKYLMQLKPKIIPEPISVSRSVVRTPILPMESDTDDLESICDGRSESGGESVETDSVFFGNFDDTKEMFAELGLGYDLHKKMNNGHEQIDSGFMGETNIILSGDSDSEHRSVISIITGRDGRASSASVTKLDDPPYIHSVEC